ncbi:MAG: DegV family protein [Chloroflexota bacterium]|nr:DegV family protein [Chloroflexota bacterium]
MPLPVRIVTDSTCNLPPDLIQQYQIPQVPILVLFGKETYREGVDITPREFYDRVERTGFVPTTSQPAAGAFAEVYRQVAQQAEQEHGPGACQILSIHLTGRLIGVLASAYAATQMLPDLDIALFDTLSVSLGSGFCVLEAARMAADGTARDQIVERLAQIRDRLNIYLTPATLKYLQMSGRIGRLQGALAALLNVKPIIRCHEGLLDAFEKVRTRRGSLDRILALTAEACGSTDLVDIGVIHADAPEEARELADRIRASFNYRNLFVETLSLALGVHGGPGMIGIVSYKI